METEPKQEVKEIGEAMAIGNTVGRVAGTTNVKSPKFNSTDYVDAQLKSLLIKELNDKIEDLREINRSLSGVKDMSEINKDIIGRVRKAHYRINSGFHLQACTILDDLLDNYGIIND